MRYAKTIRKEIVLGWIILGLLAGSGNGTVRASAAAGNSDTNSPPVTAPALPGSLETNKPPATEPAAATHAPAVLPLSDMNLEDLMQLKISLATRQKESVFETPAAVYVLTQEDLRRSGVTCIPEALRMVPGLEVARIDSSHWAISARGSQYEFADKLLVQIDGRSVYSPMFAGTCWDVQDLVMEDIDRIEVVRGPGGTMWGDNAMNGVINIVTKSARDTQGLLVSALGGTTDDRAIGSFRYGAAIDQAAWFRVYGKYRKHAAFDTLTGENADDGWHVERGGFRMDGGDEADNALTLQGDIYTGKEDTQYAYPISVPPYVNVDRDGCDLAGGNVVGKWKHVIADDSDLNLQLYYDRTVRSYTSVREDRDTVDADFQHTFMLGECNHLIWGAESRLTYDHMRNSDMITFDPASEDFWFANGFVQDEIDLYERYVTMTVGSKFEYNNYTHFEIQPNARLTLTDQKHHSLWAAVSRAVRVPNRFEETGSLMMLGEPQPGMPPVYLNMLSGDDLKSCELLAYELGYRLRLSDDLAFDTATFYNDYVNDIKFMPGQPYMTNNPPPPHIVVPQKYDNSGKYHTYGVEEAVNWRVLKSWQLRPSYTWFHTVNDESTGFPQPPDTANQVAVRSDLDLPFNLEFDAMLYYVNHIDLISLNTLSVPSYVRLDLRLGWRPNEHWEFSLVGQNLLDSKHQEFDRGFFNMNMVEIPLACYAEVTCRY